ncbi:RraA family protein [Shouchella shacheensis]|uniref:RraA family protein n=1 Tax=Shouchella shacheensis TaxID=1649580 RepID=UPI00073FB465|nr:RraA family protein [Shouchella shacheensis]
MLTVGKGLKKYTDDQQKMFRMMRTSTVGHFTDFGFLIGYECTLPGTSVGGEVVTVKLTYGDGSPLTAALEETKAGDIVVIDTSGDRTHACWGEFRTRRAEAIGLAAVIVGGAVTDIDYLQTSSVPVFYQSVSPKTTRALNMEGEINTPISVGGVVFEPGDYVIADQDGIYRFNPVNYEQIAQAALKKEQREQERRQQMT